MISYIQRALMEFNLKRKQSDKDFYNVFPPKCLMWYREAYEELNCWSEERPINYDYALYPKRFYKAVELYSEDKVYDYCFIGGFKTDEKTVKGRVWILDFIKNNMNEKSYLQFTDKKTKHRYKPLGDYDFTLKASGFVPKEHPRNERNKFDENYFRTMKRSKFALCPAGDLNYSMRFYEALMCKSIPIVNSANETFRSEAESELDYKYYLTTDSIQYREDWVEHNYNLFLKYHTLEYKQCSGK